MTHSNHGHDAAQVGIPGSLAVYLGVCHGLRNIIKAAQTWFARENADLAWPTTK